MTDLLSLPTELQQQCFNYLDGANLKSVRLTSRILRDIATELLFALVTLRIAEESAYRFTSLVNDVSLQCCIRTVYDSMAHFHHVSKSNSL
jgi:hypothetical protein